LNGRAIQKMQTSLVPRNSYELNFEKEADKQNYHREGKASQVQRRTLN